LAIFNSLRNAIAGIFYSFRFFLETKKPILFENRLCFLKKVSKRMEITSSPSPLRQGGEGKGKCEDDLIYQEYNEKSNLKKVRFRDLRY
jgi:hypothetical protein